jgi:ankyrin repeat protein
MIVTQTGFLSVKDSALLQAAAEGKAQKVQRLLEQGADVNAQENKGTTALMLAAFGGRIDIIHLLLAKGANVNAQEQQGATALMLAASQGHPPTVVQALLGRGAEVNKQNNDGWTALMMAARGGQVAVVQALLNAGADIDIKNNDNKTALMLVESQYHSTMAPLLGSSVAQPEQQQEPPRVASKTPDDQEAERIRQREQERQPSDAPRHQQEALRPERARREIEQQRRTALVIGNADYTEGRLRNAVNDANDMAATLQRLNFKVTVLLNANQRAMEEAIDSFSRALRQGGIGLFYYAGHGVQVDGQNYLLPIGARITREADVKYGGVHVNWIFESMHDAENAMNIIILDACRNNPFIRSLRSIARGLAVTQATRGALIAYATAPGSVADDGLERNGIYTKYLLRHLGIPGLSIEDMFKKVRIDVVAETKGQQIPWESSSLTENFYFAGRVAEN